MKLGVQFKEIAEIVGASPATVANWVRGETKPSTRYYPAIMDFLGYCPYQRADTLGRKILLHRIHRGLSHSKPPGQTSTAGSLERWETHPGGYHTEISLCRSLRATHGSGHTDQTTDARDNRLL